MPLSEKAEARPVIAICAGESSGDRLGASLIEALKEYYPNAYFVGSAGPMMRKAGCEPLLNQESIAVMGIVEVLKQLFPLLKIRRKFTSKMQALKPDIYIGIDAPDFNLFVERKLHSSGIKSVHYVSPSVWAWKKGRIDTLKVITNRVLTLFPFEAELYAEKDVPVTFVGHPFADEIEPVSDIDSPDSVQDPSGENRQRIIALLPGSRRMEVERLLPEYVRLAGMYTDNTRFVIPAATKALHQYIRKNIPAGLQDKITIKQEGMREVVRRSDYVVVASGTAALEVALLNKPMVVVYRVSWLTYQIVKRMITISWVSLPNILADKMIVPELLQDDMTAANIYQELQRLEGQPKTVQAMKEALLRIHHTLRKNAALSAAKAVKEVIESA
jgi:lipid-A-disaccharide synthase